MIKWLNDMISFLAAFFYTRKKTPLIIQMENVECGAVCLKIILAYYGRYVPIEELRIACGVSRDGCSAYGIAKACERYDLDCDGYSLSVKELQSLSLPVILYWGFEHFVILEGIKHGKYDINDPAVGHITVSESEFKLNYTGVVLQLKPKTSFMRGGQNPSFVKSLKLRLSGASAAIIFFSLMQLALVFLTLVITILAQVFVDQILNVQLSHWRWWFFGIAAAAFILISLLTVAEKFVLVKLQVKLATQYSAAFFQHIFKLPIAFFEQRYSSEIAYRSSLNQEIANFITGNMLETVIQALEVIAYGAVMFFYSPIIAFVGLLCGCLNLFTVSILHKRRLGIFARYQQEMGKTAAFSIGALEGFETWKCLGCENRLFSWLAALYTRAFNMLHRLKNTDVVLANTAAFSLLAAQTALFAFGGWSVIHGTLTPGQFLALFLLMSGFLRPIINLVEINQNFELFRIDVSRLDDVMNYPVDWQFKQKKCISVDDSFNGNIEIRNVTYRYNATQPPILKSISLSIKKGSCVALVGATGSGKTTVQKLLAGFILPESGEVQIGGIDLLDYPAEFLSSQMGFIFANPFIFEDTVKRNVTLYNVGVADEQIKQAMTDACLWERFSDEKLQTILDEEGRNISGGEQQRLEIARCLVRNPSFIALDEATSSLDESTEAAVLSNIKKRGCTMLILTHRLSAINMCDEVFVLDQGMIVQKGTPKELGSIEGIFKKMLIVEME